MRERCVLRCSGMLLLMAAASAFGEASECWRNPPEPNADSPADYVAWARRCSSEGVKDNSWEVYRLIEGRMSVPAADARAAMTRAVRWRWDSERFGAAVSWLDGAGPVFALLRQASKRRDCAVPLKDDGPFLLDVGAEERNAIRVAARGMMADGWRKFYGGNRDQLGRDGMVLLRVVHHMDRAITRSGRVGPGSFARTVYRDVLLQYLDRVEERAGTARRLVGGIAEADPEFESVGRTVMMQYARLADLYQRVYRRDAETGKLAIDRAALEPFRERFGGLRKLSEEAYGEEVLGSGYEASVGFLRRHHESLAKWADDPFVEGDGKIEALEAKLDADGTALTRGTIRKLRRYVVERQKTKATRRATHLIYGLWAHRGKAGAFPESLDALEIADLGAIRRDPFSGGDFGYARRGKDFVLYSAGVDMADQGGAHREDWGAGEAGDYVFWPVQAIVPPWERPRILVTSDGRVLEQARDGSGRVTEKGTEGSVGATEEAGVEKR